MVCGILALLLVGCGAKAGAPASTRSKDLALHQIAADFAVSGDLVAAQNALDHLELANPAQLLVTMAETEMSQGKSAEEVEPLARLAGALGTTSPRLVAYYEPTQAPVAATATLVPGPISPEPTFTPAPPEQVATATPEAPTSAPTATAVPATATPVPEATPHVVADGTVNLRSGPGRSFPVIGRLAGGQAASIEARNDSGDWWRIAWSGQGQAWVAGTVIRVLGAIDTVAVADDIPTPPPAPTQAPVTPKPAEPTAAPKPAVDFRIIEQRLLHLDENAGCQGNHNAYVQVLDVNGAPLNGAVVQRIYANETTVSGDKDCRWHIGTTGEGCAHFDLYGGGDSVRVLSDPTKGAVVSETSRKLSMQGRDIPNEDLIASGYCSSVADCEWRKNPGPDLPPQLCTGHFSWQVKFQRTW